jgi:ATP-binding cassette subfamily F protein uup
LSGGERNRVILAKLFTRPANLLVLDEPTNDLDVETLEALEARLAEYDGTLIVVSHDRYFLDAVVTSTLVFESGGSVTRHAGGYSDWLERERALAVVDTPTESAAPARERSDPPPPPRKLSYMLQRELDGLPARIAELETQVAGLQAAAAAPGFYRRPQAEVQDGLAGLAAAERELDAALERWTDLEDQAAAIAATRERSRD